MNLLSLLRRVSLKHVRHQKARTIIAMLGIALGVATIVAIDIVNASVLRSFEDSINHITGKAVLQVTDGESGFPESLLERVQNVPGVEYAVPVIQTNALFSGGSRRSFMILGVDALQWAHLIFRDVHCHSSRAMSHDSPIACSRRHPHGRRRADPRRCFARDGPGSSFPKG